jgi:aminoglycoside phosphotransferase (APT) family kinase protein
VVDVTRPDGSVLEGFLRLERAPTKDNPWSLEKETRIVEALAATNVPVPAVHGWNGDLTAALFARDPGRSDLDEVDDPVQQRRVMEDFIRVMARMHTLDLDALGLDDVMPGRPTTPADCALGEVDLNLRSWHHFLADYTEPLVTYGVDWLRRCAPESVARVSLVQGDTGPVNFMFQGDRVSSVIDWEQGHFGDPLEDLGNLCVREFWNPCGGLEGLFELYEQESGIPYSRSAAQYYRVQQNVRGMIPIHYVCENAHPRESVAWYLCYRYVGDRATCEALAEAAGIEVDRPAMPAEEGESDILADSAVFALDRDVVPELSDSFAASRARDVRTLVQCADRRRRYGAAIAAAEVEELGELIGARPVDVSEGLQQLDVGIAERRFEDDDVIRYLTRRAYRDEWLHAPAVELYPARTWSPLD